jgi:hypothetical protein
MLDYIIFVSHNCKKKNSTPGVSCEVIDTTRDSVLTISNCLDSSQGSGFGPSGLGRARTDHISIQESGFFRIAFSGDVDTSSANQKGPTMISLEKDVSGIF